MLCREAFDAWEDAEDEGALRQSMARGAVHR
jgi:hypothetical protein